MKTKLKMMVNEFTAKHVEKGIEIETETHADIIFAQISKEVSPEALISGVNVGDAIKFYGVGEILDEVGETKVREFFKLPAIETDETSTNN